MKAFKIFLILITSSLAKAENSKIKTTVNNTGKAISFVYNNSGRLLSKNSIATAMILGAPYIYITDSDILSKIATLIADMTFKISGAATSGFLRAAFNNKIIIAKLYTIIATKYVAAEAAKTATSKTIEYGSLIIGSGIRGYFGLK